MLTLPIKKQWYDMIKCGEKKEEYREIKPYYISRFKKYFEFDDSNNKFTNDIKPILFRNGYSNTSPSFVANCSISIKCGNPRWGAIDGIEYFVLTIEKIED